MDRRSLSQLPAACKEVWPRIPSGSENDMSVLAMPGKKKDLSLLERTFSENGLYPTVCGSFRQIR